MDDRSALAAETSWANLTSMTPERWQQVKVVLYDALELPPQRRPEFLNEACSSDYLLRKEVESLLLLGDDEARTSFLESAQHRVMLPPGTRLRDYEVQSLLGVGGMGEVYCAHDPRLGRAVAIKVLPSAFVGDPDRLRRFEQEARAAAALNHPNIVAIFDIGTAGDGIPYVVSELLEGETLRQCLNRGPLPSRQTVDFALQLASGLATAHRKGIVHRDLKPENLFLTTERRLKILDFGLAKLARGRGSSPFDAPTLPQETEAGVVLGTVGYMSPEQVRGVAVDHRADIFAFGAIVYEMLTGRRAFQKPTSPETMTAILNEGPPAVSQIVPGASPALAGIVHRCLEKNPQQRFQSTPDLVSSLESLSGPAGVVQSDHHLVANIESLAALAKPDRIEPLLPAAPKIGPEALNRVPAKPWWNRKATPAAAACIAVAGLLYTWIAPQIETLWRLRELQQLKVVPLTALPGNVASPSFSPDGSQLAFAWDGENNGAGYDLYVKVVGSDKPLRLTNHPAAWVSAAWSPDGRSIAMSRSAGKDDSGIYLVLPTGGPERKLIARTALAWYGNELSWSPDGKRLAYTDVNQDPPHDVGLFSLSLDTLAKTKLQTDCGLTAMPRYSPTGKFLAFVCGDTGFTSSLRLLSLKDGTQTRLLSQADLMLGIAWSSDERRIAFSSESNYGALWETSLARPSQIDILPVGHDATELAAVRPGPGLAYVQGSTNVNIWRLDLLASPPQARKLVISTRSQTGPSISPDGSMIAFESTRSGASEVWVSNVDGSNAQQLTHFGSSDTGSARWSPDGKLLAFDSRAGGEANIWLVDPRGGVPHKLDTDIHDNSQPSWSHDGAWIYFVNGADTGERAVWKAPPNGGHALPITKGGATFPLASPDGQYVFFARGSQLWRATVDGLKEEPVPGMPELSGWGDEWFPAGTGIYFLSHANRKPVINLFDLQTRKVRPVYLLEKPTPEWIGGMPVSKDGKFMLFPQVDQSSSDLMLIENWQ